MRKWGDFSSSQFKPLLWMLIGPLLILLTACVSLPIFYDPFSSFLTICGFLLIWKWRLSGLLTALFLFFGYIGFQFFLSTDEMTLGRMLSSFSFSFALVISFLSIEEVKAFYIGQKKSKDQSVLNLKHALHHLSEKGVAEKRFMESEIETLQKKLQDAQGEIKRLLQLVDASHLEAEKTCRQNQNLVKESLEQHRRSKRLELQTDRVLAELERLKKERDLLAKQADSRLQKLNFTRMECAQIQLLLDAAKKPYAHISSLAQPFQSQAVPISSSQMGTQAEDESDRLGQERTLRKLERDKVTTKGVYAQMEQNYQTLLARLKKAKTSEKKTIQLSSNQLRDQIKQTKSELISIERELFVRKKKMQQEGLEVS